MEIEDFKGQTIVHISNDDVSVDFVVFDGKNYKSYSLYSEEDSSNDVEVWLESVVGDLDDLIGEPLLLSEVVMNEGDMKTRSGYDDCGTWTFYKFATRKGYVDLRFCGRSNGYYSETVSLNGGHCVDEEYVEKVKDKNKSRYKI